MKKLSSDLKRALAALAHQDASEFLTMSDKMKTIGYGIDSENISMYSPQLIPGIALKKRIALLSNGRDLHFPINYTIEACKRQYADIDLLLYGEFDRSGISLIESNISEAGIKSKRIQLGDNIVSNIIEYASKSTSLIFIASTTDNSIARVLVEETMPNRVQRIAVPLVLIDEKKPVSAENQSVA